jgi:hypothetical protein
VSNWKSIVKTVSPLLGAALGGPLGGMAGKLISEGILGDPAASSSDIYKALLDPENLVKLKSIEQEFELKLKELDVDLAKIGQADRESARGLAKSKGTGPQVIISSIFISGFFVVLAVLFSGLIVLTDSMENLAFLLLGVLASGVTMVLKFWFGGSPHDSEQMDNIYNSIPREQLKR